VCAFDFDGTLAPIVPRPDDAAMRPEVERCLARLVEANCRVVVISGRSVADLRQRVRIPGVLLAGNHGMESPFVTEGDLALSRSTSVGWRQHLVENGVESLEGVVLEDKTFSLALHYRNAPRRVQAREHLRALAGRLTPSPRLVAGKEVLNLVHPALPHKGTALTAFQDSLACQRSLYVGDDVTDEDVFALASPALFSVRVGRASADVTHARYFIPRQRDVRRLIEALIEITAHSHRAIASM
jgi:trehalose 6-phosphate phosphatase